LADYPIDPDSPEWDEQCEAALTTQKEAIASVLADYPYDWMHRLVRGDPLHALLKTAEELDALMIVVGAPAHRSYGGTGGSLGRSLSRLVLERSQRPVLVVKGQAEPQS
jgi:nucleotide-binding universal stress UspA family protein